MHGNSMQEGSMTNITVRGRRLLLDLVSKRETVNPLSSHFNLGDPSEEILNKC